ncbi:MAG: hypothetical protein IPK32_22110 [Verrucomicrobiaceae bacterium]|nr:hypothetical protein [Verrucomicrobiaceae bacterium]
MTTNQPNPPIRWFERIWVGFFCSFLVCASAAGISMFLRFTLADSYAQRIEAGIFSAFVFGGLAFVFFAGPIQALLILILRLLKTPLRWRSLCSQIPALIFFFYVLSSSMTALSPSGERKWFEQAVGVPLPSNANLVLAQHGLGLQDRRGLWLLEGEPSDFDRLVIARGWALNDDELIQMADQGIRRAREIFSKSAPWHPDLIYFWEANKDAVKGPLGMSYLFAEKNRKRWAVWVMD